MNARPRQRTTPFADSKSRFIAGRMGMWVFLASLAMLFGATLVGFAVIRSINADAWPEDLPPLPRELWLSTLLLAFSSATMQCALEAIRRDRRATLLAGLGVSLFLGLGFLAMQSWCWISWLDHLNQWWHEGEIVRFAVTSFYVMTILHAVHVIGGLLPMILVTARAGQGRYSSEQHAGVHYTTLYWHFLGGVWFVLFVVLLFWI